MHVCEDQRLILDVFINDSVFNFETVPLSEPGAHQSYGLAAQQIPGILLSLPPQHLGLQVCLAALVCLVFNVGAGDRTQIMCAQKTYYQMALSLSLKHGSFIFF